MNTIFSEAITVLLSSGATGFFAWFFTKKKYNSEVDSQVIENMKESLEFYKHLSDDNKKRLAEVLEQNKAILEQNEKLINQNESLKKEISELKKKVEKLTKQHK